MTARPFRAVVASLSLLIIALAAGAVEAFQPTTAQHFLGVAAAPNSATSRTAALKNRGSSPVRPSVPCRSRRAQRRDDDESSSSTSTPQQQPRGGGFFQAVGNFFEELDAFMDDASARRLGNGAAFYGKRRSNFYGSQDKNKKRDKAVFDPTEDYQGPSTSGFFKWMPDEDGEMRPVTRMKNQVIEKKKPPTAQQHQPQKSAPSWFGRSNDD